MKSSKILSAVLAGALMLGSAATAFAATSGGYHSTFGTIKSISGGSFTLTDGNSFSVPYGFDVSRLHVGEKVNVVWLPDGTSASQPDDVSKVVSTITVD